MAAILPALIKHLRRVAIVGLPNSGKTVLLTALLIHLENRSAALTTSAFGNCAANTVGGKIAEKPAKASAATPASSCAR